MSAYEDTEEAHLQVWYFSVYTARTVAVFIKVQNFPSAPPFSKQTTTYKVEQAC
jgi:hypothetical protein